MKSKMILTGAGIVNAITLVAISYIILLTDIEAAAILSLALFVFCGLSSGLNMKAIEYLKEKQNNEH